MAHTETYARVSAPQRQLFAFRPNSAAVVVAALTAWRLAAARRRALANLTPYELRDIGYPDIDRPVLEIEAGLMTKLMSMR